MRVEFKYSGKTLIGSIKKKTDVYMGMGYGYETGYVISVDGVKRNYVVPSSECRIIEEDDYDDIDEFKFSIVKKENHLELHSYGIEIARIYVDKDTYEYDVQELFDLAKHGFDMKSLRSMKG